MKKIYKVLVLFLLVATTIFAGEGYIASFNTLRIGKAQKDYKLMSQILENFDVVGLIEVIDEVGVEKLVKELNKTSKSKWEYYISPYPVGKSSYKEYFGYIWKKDKVKFLGERGYYEDKEKFFSRQPFGADFKIENFDFTFVLVHSIFGKKEAERRAEAFKMVDVYNYFQNLDKKENDIIIAGDFNLSANDEAFEGLFYHKDEIIYCLNPTIKTTLGKNKLANSYDNMFISKKYTTEFKGKSGALNFAKGDYRTMKNKISDHIPIFIVVDTTVDDD